MKIKELLERNLEGKKSKIDSSLLVVDIAQMIWRNLVWQNTAHFPNLPNLPNFQAIQYHVLVKTYSCDNSIGSFHTKSTKKIRTPSDFHEIWYRHGLY